MNDNRSEYQRLAEDQPKELERIFKNDPVRFEQLSNLHSMSKKEVFQKNYPELLNELDEETQRQVLTNPKFTRP